MLLKSIPNKPFPDYLNNYIAASISLGKLPLSIGTIYSLLKQYLYPYIFLMK